MEETRTILGLLMLFSRVCFSLCLDFGVADLVELDIETGKVLFEWHSLDHVSPDGKFGLLPL